MSGIFKPKEATEVAENKETGDLLRKRQAVLARADFTSNTRTSGAKGSTGPASTHRSTLGG